MKDIIDSWNKEEFKAFILLHIANADLKMSQNEVFMILDEVDEKSFKQIEMVWTDSNDFECIQIIRDLKNKHYPGDEGKELLVAEMTKIANADNKFSASEQSFIRSIQRII